MGVLKVKQGDEWVAIPSTVGPRGAAGQDGSPGVGVPSGGTAGQVLKKKTTGTDYDTEWADESGSVTDVQVNGTSVVTSGVANVPVGTNSTIGALRGGTSYGITIDTGSIHIIAATSSDIKGGNHSYKPIVPTKQNESAFYGLAKAAGDSTQSSSSNSVGTYTETAKSKISDMLNAPVTVSGSTPSITAMSGVQYVCGEVSTLSITVPENGCFDVVFDSGSTATVLTLTLPTGYTLEWVNDFDDTALDADTTYEINIKIVGTKCLGVVGSWT